jgi:hypothetical protein
MSKPDLPRIPDGAVDEVQREVTGELRRDVERHEHKLEGHSDRIGDLAAQLGQVKGEVRLLVMHYERTTALVVQQAASELEVRKTQELAVIEDKALRIKHRREVAIKLLAVLTGLWGILSALLAHRC